MILKIIFATLFIGLFLYSFIRPFSNIVAKWFLRLGAVVGLMNIVDTNYLNSLAGYLGISTGKSLLTYITFITIFLFVYYTIERFSKLEKTISNLVTELAVLKQKRKDEDCSKNK